MEEFLEVDADPELGKDCLCLDKVELLALSGKCLELLSDKCLVLLLSDNCLASLELLEFLVTT